VTDCHPDCFFDWTLLHSPARSGADFDGDNAETVTAGWACVHQNVYLPGVPTNWLAVLLLKGFNHVLVNERCNVKQVDVGFDDVHHVFGVHSLRTHERELTRIFLLICCNQGAESVRLARLPNWKYVSMDLMIPTKILLTPRMMFTLA
jgi:hypothetical protein